MAWYPKKTVVWRPHRVAFVVSGYFPLNLPCLFLFCSVSGSARRPSAARLSGLTQRPAREPVFLI
jgi:hypothetical protein